MSCVAKPALKPSTMANACVMSLPAIFTSRNSFPQISKPFKLNLSCSYSCSLPTSSSIKKKTHLVTLVAQTSDWAQQEEGNTVAVEEQGESFDFAAAGESAADEESYPEPSEESYPEPSEEAKVFVGNLPFDFESENLAQLFEQAGVVEIAEVIYNRETERSRGFGFVTMSTVEEAEKAVELFNRYDLGGRILNVNKAAPRGTRVERPPRSYEPSFRIYVGNLPWDIDNSRLEQVFSEHGKVVDARVVFDRETGRSRGFGFVTMSSEAELNDAISNLDGQSLGGRAIRVNVAEERPRRAY